MVLVPTAKGASNTMIKMGKKTNTKPDTSSRMTENRARKVIEEFYKNESGLSAIYTSSQSVFDYAFAEAVKRMCIHNALPQKLKKKPSANNYEPVFHIELGKNEKSAIIYNDKKQLAISLKVKKRKR